MKIAISSTGETLDSQVDRRFGRCQYFLIVDSDTMDLEVIHNAATGAMGGAGIQAAQSIANKDVKAVITGNIGPNAFQTLSGAGIEIATGATGTVREAIGKFNAGELRNTGEPTVRGHFGMGQGRRRQREEGL